VCVYRTKNNPGNLKKHKANPRCWGVYMARAVGEKKREESPDESHGKCDITARRLECEGRS